MRKLQNYFSKNHIPKRLNLSKNMIKARFFFQNLLMLEWLD